jgi:RNA polymerase sigma-70 factor, ECF subfamily
MGWPLSVDHNPTPSMDDSVTGSQPCPQTCSHVKGHSGFNEQISGVNEQIPRDVFVTAITSSKQKHAIGTRCIEARGKETMSTNYAMGRFYTAAAPTETPDTSDAALIQSIASGDKGAMRILFTRHNVRVYRFLLRLVDKSTAEDLVSEVFLDVWRQAGRFQGRSRVTTWLLAIARNRALSALRRRSAEELDDEQAAAIEDLGSNAEVTLQNPQKTEILRRSLTQLSPAHREVIDLVYYHEKSIDEVAEIVGVPPNTVTTRIFYARRQIAELMAAQGIARAVV